MVSMTPDHQFRKVGMGVIPSPSPFFTPRPDRYRIRASEPRFSTNRLDKDQEVHVQVILRCRPLSEDEQRGDASKVIKCSELKREVTVSQIASNNQVDRTFTFDKVFGPNVKQRSIYDQAIAPIVREVLDGYECTVFAYGQTGTGKTYTMEGTMRTKGGELCDEAGVIPRAVRQLFDILEAQNADYSMKVTFLELYNEEITDLLAREDNLKYMDEKQKKSVSLMEDGKGSVLIRGLEEEIVYSADDIYKVIERGASKRRTADTLLNKRSSRSHSIFTIIVHVKENIGDEEVIKCGKLNLVDLAGSENISRSGVREGRAREVGEINKSLLTLGRVINALVEHSAHVPYRDSKLTRLLRDSLGGKTKTCILATISPSGHCLEETLSTLDYASRAKNIKNKPEINQKMSKTVLLKDLYMELERMKQEVRAAREKTGVYIPHERYAQDVAEKKARIARIEQLEAELERSRKEKKLDSEVELQNCKKKLDNTTKLLHELEEKHKAAILKLQEKESIISKLLNSENFLIERVKDMRSTLESASGDMTSLVTRIDEKNELDTHNHKLPLTLRSELDQSLKDLHKTILGSIAQQQEQLKGMEEFMGSFIASKEEATRNLDIKIQKVAETHTSIINTLMEYVDIQQRKNSEDLEYIKSGTPTMDMQQLLESLVVDAKDAIDDVHCSLSMQKELLAFSVLRQEQGLQRTLVSTQDITKATLGFFDDICRLTSEIISKLEESKTTNNNYFLKFAKMFKEESAKEEQKAIEKIVSALTALSTNKEALVSQALQNIKETQEQDTKVHQQNLSAIQEVSSVAKNALTEHTENVESHFFSDLFFMTEIRETANECIRQCNDKVSYSKEQWNRSQHSISNLNHERLKQLSFINESMCDNKARTYHFLTSSLAKDAEFDAQVSSVLNQIRDSFMMDSETKIKMNTFASQCQDPLKSVQNERILSAIRNKTEQCLIKGLMVDSHALTELKVTEAPSSASIKDMRTLPADVSLAKIDLHSLQHTTAPFTIL